MFNADLNEKIHQEEQLLEDFFKDKADLTIVTYKREIHVFKNFIKEHSIDSLLDVTDDIAKLYHKLLMDKYYNKTFKKNTVLKILFTLKTLYSFAKKHIYIKNNPFANIDVPEQDTGHLQDKRILTLEELDMLLSYTFENDLKYHSIILLMITSRFSAKEITNLKWGNLFVDRNDHFGAEIPSRKDKKKSTRIIAIRDDAVQALFDYRAEYLKIKDADRISEEERDNYIFAGYASSSNPGKLTDAAIRKMIYSLCDKLNIKRVSPKDLTHMSMILARYYGASNDQLMKQAGFERIDSLRKYDYSVNYLIDPACDIIKLYNLSHVQIRDKLKEDED